MQQDDQRINSTYNETGYAYLADDLLEDILEGTPATSSELRRIFEEITNWSARFNLY